MSERTHVPKRPCSYHETSKQEKIFTYVELDFQIADLTLFLSPTGIVRVQTVWNNARRREVKGAGIKQIALGATPYYINS